MCAIPLPARIGCEVEGLPLEGVGSIRRYTSTEWRSIMFPTWDQPVRVFFMIFAVLMFAAWLSEGGCH